MLKACIGWTLAPSLEFLLPGSVARLVDDANAATDEYVAAASGITQLRTYSFVRLSSIGNAYLESLHAPSSST